MRIKWTNLLAATLALVGAVVLWNHAEDAASLVRSIGSIGPGHSPHDQARGLWALALAIISTIVIARILACRGGGGPNR